MKETNIDFDPAPAGRGMLAFMFGFGRMIWIVTAITHVRKAFERRKSGRVEIILDIANALRLKKIHRLADRRNCQFRQGVCSKLLFTAKSNSLR
jgi:hypothetical protein